LKAPSRRASWETTTQRGSLYAKTIIFIPLSADYHNPALDWARLGAEYLARQCPLCWCDSIVGHGRRRKQAHDETHECIPIRRGLCNLCHTTFTFLPRFSLPYTHYSLLARSQALRRYFLEHHTWEDAAPVVKNPDRVAAPSTLRRWFRGLDSSSSFAFLRRMLETVSQALARGVVVCHDGWPWSWRTAAAFLQVLWPLRL
jgi:hypothetical protein